MKPSVKADGQKAKDAETREDDVQTPAPKTGGGGGGGDQHPLIQGLLVTLPPPGGEWSSQERVNWLTMAASIFKMIYTEQSPSAITITTQGGSSSAS